MFKDIYEVHFENVFKNSPPTINLEDEDFVIFGQTAFKNMNFKQFHYW